LERAPHPAIPARCRARHPPLKGRDEAALPLDVIPAQAGIQLAPEARKKRLDPGFRRGDASFGGGDYWMPAFAGIRGRNPSAGMTRGGAMTMLAEEG
jgi:hypothetical protein